MKKILKYKKEIIIILISLIILCGLIVFASSNVGNTKIRFSLVNEKTLPRKITTDIIPKYRNLERAMACVADDKVFIVVFRGEKPCCGYDVKINKIKLEAKKEKNNMKVFATFTDPENSETLPQVKTYPVSVAKAQITGLPDTIELISEYAN